MEPNKSMYSPDLEIDAAITRRFENHRIYD
jgi:hypothetical protein